MFRINKGNSVATWSIYIVVVVFVQIPTMRAKAADAKPENAALLYYQAMLICPDWDSIPTEDIHSVFGSILEFTKETGSVEQVRKYVEDYKPAIQIAEAASKILHCDWALPYAPYSSGSEQGLKLFKQANVLAFLIGSEARILAADGDCKAGFTRCLILYRIARHFSEWQGHGNRSANILDGYALYCIRMILHETPPDENTLRWLSDQLAAMPPVAAPLSTRMKNNFESMFLGLNKRILQRVRQNFAEEASTEKQRKDAMNLTDDEVLNLIRQATAKFLDPALEILASDIPYVPKYEKINSLVKEFGELYNKNPAVIIPTISHAELLLNNYNNDISYRTLGNSLKAAIEIYYIRARTGRLPKTIPDGLPKDLYSGKDFEYEITEDGFLLRCRGKDLSSGRNNYFAFKVQGKGE